MRKFFSDAAIFITTLTAIITAVLAALKLGFGYWGHSHALIADGVHSLSDVLIDILIIFAAHFGSKKADIDHPYGHGRIETAATFGLALLLSFAGAGIILNSGSHLWNQTLPPIPDKMTLWIAILAIVINESIFRYTMKIAKKINSSLLLANAWHSRSDVAVSVIVVFSIVGALFGYPYLDPIGAIIVGLMIIKLGFQLAWQSISELIDTGVDENMLDKIQTVIKNVKGVNTLHMLRTRTIKGKILLDVHILVDPHISVSEGHYIGEQVIASLYKNINDIHDITLHVDPEDDEIFHSSVSLPNRESLIVQLNNCWKSLPGFTNLIDLKLHYLSGKVEIEIYFAENFIQTHFNQMENLSNQYRSAVDHLKFIHHIKLWAG